MERIVAHQWTVLAKRALDGVEALSPERWAIVDFDAMMQGLRRVCVTSPRLSMTIWWETGRQPGLSRFRERPDGLVASGQAPCGGGRRRRGRSMGRSPHRSRLPRCSNACARDGFAVPRETRN